MAALRWENKTVSLVWIITWLLGSEHLSELSKSVQETMTLTCILEVFGSNLDRNTDYLDCFPLSMIYLAIFWVASIVMSEQWVEKDMETSDRSPIQCTIAALSSGVSIKPRKSSVMIWDVQDKTRNGNLPNASKKLYRLNLARYPDCYFSWCTSVPPGKFRLSVLH
jgi:hypothetical protein